jgi:hypothetical protein
MGSGSETYDPRELMAGTYDLGIVEAMGNPGRAVSLRRPGGGRPPPGGG